MTDRGNARIEAERVVNDLLTLAEAAEVTGLSVRILRRAIRDRRLGYLKLGTGRSAPVRIPRLALDDWLLSSYVPPVPDT